MNVIILLLAVFGLAYLVKDSNGPWDVMSWLRNHLFRNKYVGTFFYNLLDCYFCTGTWAGVGIYLLTAEIYKLSGLIIWGLSGGAASLILSAVLARLHRE